MVRVSGSGYRPQQAWVRERWPDFFLQLTPAVLCDKVESERHIKVHFWLSYLS